MTKHEYIIKITEVVSLKATCLKTKVGATFINSDYEILATGYNGAPRGLPSCQDEKKCLLNTLGKCIRCTHAEMNGIAQAAKRGTSLNKSILYITHSPCESCANVLINVGITKIFYHVYKGEGLSILEKAKIMISKY